TKDIFIHQTSERERKPGGVLTRANSLESAGAAKPILACRSKKQTSGAHISHRPKEGENLGRLLFPATMDSVREWASLHSEIASCALCPRLREHCAQVASVKRRAYRDWEYWGRPVQSFGDPKARVLVLGLAPAAHGANRTGRMFTGDRSGEWLYRA